MIWGFRYVAPRLILSVALFWTAFKVTAQSFFVSKIVSNFMAVVFSNVWAGPRFIASALNSAEPQVLTLISACGIAGFFLAVKLFRNIRSIVERGNVVAVFNK